MHTFRVIVDEKAGSGAWNMAVDEVLLEAAIERQQCTARFYRWQEATISLGYFQDQLLASMSQLAELPVVRRLSGGGAILHHHELTYSFAVPATHPLAGDPPALYEHLHNGVIRLLERRAISARLRGPSTAVGPEAFLCFGRHDRCDVLLDGHKILGSAQRRRQRAILQHGSLLLSRSSFAPEFPGLCDLAGGVPISVGDLVGDLSDEFARIAGGTVAASGLEASECEHAAQLAENGYAGIGNVRGRTRRGRRHGKISKVENR